MKTIFFLLLSLPLSLVGEAEEPVRRDIGDRSERGTLADGFERVRGDTGRWRDAAGLAVVAAPDGAKAAPLDELADRAEGLVSGKPVWLVYRSRQLDDNDRVWISSIERKGSEIRVEMHEAIWQGYYSKTFTWYGAWSVDLGQLPPGDYHVIWTVKQFTFTKLDDPETRQAGWPEDESDTSEENTIEAKFTVPS